MMLLRLYTEHKSSISRRDYHNVFQHILVTRSWKNRSNRYTAFILEGPELVSWAHFNNYANKTLTIK